MQNARVVRDVLVRKRKPEKPWSTFPSSAVLHVPEPGTEPPLYFLSPGPGCDVLKLIQQPFWLQNKFCQAACTPINPKTICPIPLRGALCHHRQGTCNTEHGRNWAFTGETELCLKSRKFSLELYQATDPVPAGVGYKSLLTQEIPHPAWYIHTEFPEILFPFLSLWNSQHT